MGSVQMQFEVRFLSPQGETAFAFPCDGRGLVDMDTLSERERNDYLFARAVAGYALRGPDVRAVPDR